MLGSYLRDAVYDGCAAVVAWFLLIRLRPLLLSSLLLVVSAVFFVINSKISITSILFGRDMNVVMAVCQCAGRPAAAPTIKPPPRARVIST
jgi:hypothetical protein